jgi:hypothetical protein
MFGNKTAPVQSDPGTVLLLQVPRTNEKKELAAEQMFAALHGLLTSHEKSTFFNPVIHERLSFEIAVQHRRIGFYVWVPEHLKSFVEEQIYAQYPDVHISEVPDYTHSADNEVTVQATAEIKLIANEALPIKTFPSFEVDPLAGITAALAQFEDGEEAWLQVVVRPAGDGWYRRSEQYAAGIRGGGGGFSATQLLSTLSQGNDASSGGGSAPKLAEHQTARASAAEEKSHKLAYETAVRLVYRGNTSEPQARMRIQAITASFKQFNTTYLNGFVHKYLGEDPRYVELYRARTVGKRGYVCNIEEVASLYHLPHTNVETPNILWAKAKTAEPPATLPIINEANKDKISPIAATNFRGHNAMFGLPRADRGRHLYIIGQTGVGKSGLLELLTISDIYSPYGFAVIDPHGDYALSVLRRIPEHRVNDVIYFNPADTDFPVAFNPLEAPDPKLRTHIVSELIGVLKRMFESWGPRLEYILRYTLLALVEYPEATMLDITRMLTDKKFRAEVLKHVTDPVVVNFWNVEFASWNDKFATEAVAPVLNKVGAFTANPTVRNIIGQPKSSFSIRQIMDERKILIVNLSRGLIGEDNAALLGALLVTKMQMAAMSRADVDVNERAPFYLYVDEFQNFATDSFATILSEARKYGLYLTVANQYIAQMPLTVKDAVFGNVGSIIGFRMSADDSRIMTKYFEPKFEEHDLVHMHNRDFVISMTIEGEKVQAFSAATLDLPSDKTDFVEQIIANSRQNFAYKRADIEDFVRERYLSPEKLVEALKASSQKSHHNKQPARHSAGPAPKPTAQTQPSPKPDFVRPVPKPTASVKPVAPRPSLAEQLKPLAAQLAPENLSKTSSPGPKSPDSGQNPSQTRQRPPQADASLPETNSDSKSGNFDQEERSRVGSRPIEKRLKDPVTKMKDIGKTVTSVLKPEPIGSNRPKEDKKAEADQASRPPASQRGPEGLEGSPPAKRKRTRSRRRKKHTDNPGEQTHQKTSEKSPEKPKQQESAPKTTEKQAQPERQAQSSTEDGAGSKPQPKVDETVIHLR